MDNRKALIGTAKGLIVYHFTGDQNPVLASVHFEGFSVNMVFVDERTNQWWVGVSHKHWGQKLHYSIDEGRKWKEVALPSLVGKTLPNGKPARLRQVWSMAGGGKDQPNHLWMGTDPGALFKSEDNGESFQLVDSLWDHPSRQREGQWFGAGSDFPFIHSIVVNPYHSDHLYVAVSCAGVFESKDGGASWNPKNKGLKAAYLPNPDVEVGHDPHWLLMSSKDTKVLWQQNHCGIYYSKDGGDHWIDCSGEEGFPSYGFSIAIDHNDPGSAWVIPVQSDEQRIAPNLKMEVFRTVDYGSNWESDSLGLPQDACFDIVLRQAFMKRENLFLFGTTNGNLYFRNGIKSSWNLLSHHLTKVNSVFIAP